MFGAGFFGLFDLFPVGPNLIDILYPHVTKDMGMAAEEFVGDALRDLFKVKRPTLVSELAVEDNLQQEITQFFSYLVVIAGLDGIH